MYFFLGAVTIEQSKRVLSGGKMNRCFYFVSIVGKIVVDDSCFIEPHLCPQFALQPKGILAFGRGLEISFERNARFESGGDQSNIERGRQSL